MDQRTRSRWSFLKSSAAFVGLSPVMGAFRTESVEAAGPLVAYVGTFSSKLRDTLPTQVDLPPGNGRGIHIFRVDRTSGALARAGIVEMGTSPSCLALNAARTRLYSANETDRVGNDRQGTISAFSVLAVSPSTRRDGSCTAATSARTRLPCSA